MNQKILVTYASRAGATRGVAEAIASALAASGASVDLLPMADIKNLSPYQAVVAGSAIQSAAWLPEALQFIREHRSALAVGPLAVFAVCMTLAMKDGARYYPAVSEWLAPVRHMVHPVSEGLFAGALDISKIPSAADRLKFWISCRLGFWSEGDHRDWEAIRAWAGSLPPLLNRSVAHG